MRMFLSFFLFFYFGKGHAQSKPFVPLEYEYPESILNTPKTYVYKNAITAELSFRDISLSKKQNKIIVIWKEYDSSPIIDSNIEINDKGVEHYMIENGQKLKSVVTEDSVYDNHSRLGEKRQSEYFNVNPSLKVSATFRSWFLKDTTINWNGKVIPCIVIQSEAKISFINPNNATQQDNEQSNNLFYFARNVGLIKYSLERNGELSIWELQEIRKVK